MFNAFSSMLRLHKCNKELSAEVTLKDEQIAKLEKIEAEYNQFYRKIKELPDNPAFSKRFFRKNEKIFFVDISVGRVTDYFADEVVYPLHFVVYDFLENRAVHWADVPINASKGTISILSIDTDKEYWRQGIGSFVISEIIRFANEKNYYSIGVKIWTQTPLAYDNLVAFYVRNGFKISDDGAYADLKLREPRNYGNKN